MKSSGLGFPIIIPSPGRGRDLEIVWFRLPYYSVVVVEVVVSHGVYLVHYSRYLDETYYSVVVVVVVVVVRHGVYLVHYSTYLDDTW